MPACFLKSSEKKQTPPLEFLRRIQDREVAADLWLRKTAPEKLGSLDRPARGVGKLEAQTTWVPWRVRRSVQVTSSFVVARGNAGPLCYTGPLTNWPPKASWYSRVIDSIGCEDRGLLRHLLHTQLLGIQSAVPDLFGVVNRQDLLYFESFLRG